jgi:mono/diheme cytochrome c family protein
MIKKHLPSQTMIRVLAGVTITLVATLWNPAQGGPVTAGKAVVETGPDGAKLWGQNCTRCHNARPGNTYSGAQWEVIVHHMRTRAYLTMSESKAIAAFLREGTN